MDLLKAQNMTPQSKEDIIIIIVTNLKVKQRMGQSSHTTNEQGVITHPHVLSVEGVLVIVIPLWRFEG